MSFSSSQTATNQRLNYSTSFVVSSNCLDSCPKCGRNVCEHTSVADAINLPNSVSQDFSTYSSDSSLIKQLFNESTTAAHVRHYSNKSINFSRLSINNLNNYKHSSKFVSHSSYGFYLNQQRKLCAREQSIKKINVDDTLRPVSCQTMSIDPETTDKLLREFFEHTTDPCDSHWRPASPLTETLNNLKLVDDLTKVASEKCKNQKKKKTKFSNFRLFLKSGNKADTKAMRTRGLVNCLTSSASSSSSSCEELRHKLYKLENKKKQQTESSDNDEVPKKTCDVDIKLTKSLVSMGSKMSNYMCDEDDYNELHNLELCPIVVSDVDEDLTNENSDRQESKASPGPDKTHCCHNINNNTVVNNHTTTTNINNINSIISVPLNNYLFYNYERKEDSADEKVKKNRNFFKSSKQRPDSSSSNDSELTSTEATSGAAPSTQSQIPLLASCTSESETQPVGVANRLSYFSSGSTLDNSLNTTKPSLTPPPKYHSISVIFILIGLFSINFIQELFMLFYYFSTEQAVWLLYSVAGLFCGQFVTLLIALLVDIDLLRSVTKPEAASTLTSTSVTSTSPLAKEKKFYENTTDAAAHKEQNIRLIHADSDEQTIRPDVYQQQQDPNQIYLIFQNPFSKLLLLVPGFLPLSVYIQFFKHVFMYRKASGYDRFKLEFRLSLHLFLNAVFYSLPLAIINSCYLASSTSSRSLNWYYTEFYSLFSRPYMSGILLDESSVERRNQLLLLLVSIFISVSIGVCLFATYYELMKQMSQLSKKQHRQHTTGLIHLGLVEILIYFCYKFCLLTSRLAVIALFWYLFGHWLLLAAFVHIGFFYCAAWLSIDLPELGSPTQPPTGDSSFHSSTSEISAEAAVCRKTSKPRQHLNLYISCLLGCMDLFSNQTIEMRHATKIALFYFVYFMQNLTLMSYWLVSSIMSVNNGNIPDNQLSRSSSSSSSTRTLNTSKAVSVNNKFLFILKPAPPVAAVLSGEDGSYAPVTCYVTLVYLCVMLLTVFGLVLKFLHLHILRKRYRKLNA